jgi:hypothetical protein
MTRSVSAYKGGYVVSNLGTTDLDKLLQNFAILLDSAPLSYQTAADPGAGDDAAGSAGHGTFSVFSKWLNTASGTVWVCADATVNAAIWNPVAVGSVPAGSNGNVQFNDDGKLAGAAGLNYDPALLSVATGLASALGYCSEAQGQGVTAYQLAERAEGCALNGLQAGRSHLTLQLDPTAIDADIDALGELKCGGQGGQRIAIPVGWTYSFDFNIQAVDPYFNISTWRGWGTVQNTGAIVAGTHDGLKLLSAANNISSPSWYTDGQGVSNTAKMYAGGPGIEAPYWLLFDTASDTGEVVVRIGGNGADAANWYAIVTINKVCQQPLSSSHS